MPSYYCLLIVEQRCLRNLIKYYKRQKQASAFVVSMMQQTLRYGHNALKRKNEVDIEKAYRETKQWLDIEEKTNA